MVTICLPTPVLDGRSNCFSCNCNCVFRHFPFFCCLFCKKLPEFPPRPWLSLWESCRRSRLRGFYAVIVRRPYIYRQKCDLYCRAGNDKPLHSPSHHRPVLWRGSALSLPLSGEVSAGQADGGVVKFPDFRSFRHGFAVLPSSSGEAFGAAAPPSLQQRV